MVAKVFNKQILCYASTFLGTLTCIHYYQISNGHTSIIMYSETQKMIIQFIEVYNSYPKQQIGLMQIITLPFKK